jgi:hypothetical protein
MLRFNAAPTRNDPRRYGACIMIDEEKLYEAEMYSKIQKHLAWMAVHQPRVLGDTAHKMMQFTADKLSDVLSEIATEAA